MLVVSGIVAGLLIGLSIFAGRHEAQDMDRVRTLVAVTLAISLTAVVLALALDPEGRQLLSGDW